MAADEGVGRSAAWSFATQMTTAAFTAALTLYLVRALGPRNFGVFTLATSIGTLLLLPSDFGITQSASRFIAERREHLGLVAEVVADSLRLKLLIGGLLSIALFLLAEPIADAYRAPGLAAPLRWMSLAVLGQSLMGFFRYTYNSLRRLAVSFRIVLCESAAETSVSIVLVALGGGATGAAAGRAAGYAVGVAAAVALTLRAIGRRAFARSSTMGRARRELFRYAGALLLIDAAFSLSSQLAPLMIGGYLSTRAVGLYQAPGRLLTFLQYPGLSIANAVTPRLARGGDSAPDTTAFEATIRHLLVFQALLLAPLVVWARPISNLLLGGGYAQSAQILRGLAPFVFVSGLAPLVSLAVNYLGEARLRLPIAVGDLALEIVLNAILLPTIGVMGAVIATNVGAYVYVPLHLWVCRRMLGIAVRPILLTAVRVLVAAGAMAAAMLPFGTAHLSIAGWIGGSLAGLAAFVAALIATRQMTIGELRSALAWARGKRGARNGR